MNISHHPQRFFPKPEFRSAAHRDGLTLAARRAFAAFELAAPIASSSRDRAASFSSGQPARHSSPQADDCLNAKQLDRLLDRNLLARFHDAATPNARERGLESIELIVIAVTISAVLVKLFFNQ